MSSNSDEIFGNLSFVGKFPWISFSLAIGVGFLSAVFVSVGASFFIKPAAQKLEASEAEGFVDPDAKNSIDQNDKTMIIKRNIFNIEGTIPQESALTEAQLDINTNEPIKTNLPLRLLGTIFGGDPKTGLALVEDTQKKSIATFMVGDTIDKGKLGEVWREKIIIDFADHKEYLELERSELAMRKRQKKIGIKTKSESMYADQPPPDRYKEEGFERAGGDIVISKDFREKLLTVDFAKVLQDAKAEPNITGGELDGFRLSRIRSDSIYEKAGLQNDDLIKEINGVPLTDTAQAIKLLNSLRGEADIEVRLDRGGKALNMKLQVQ